MLTYRVRDFAGRLDTSHAMKALKATAQQFGLEVTLQNRRPERYHLHFQRADTTGTLEVTWNEDRQLLLISVHANREGVNGWARAECPRFAEALARALKGQAMLAQAKNRNPFS